MYDDQMTTLYYLSRFIKPCIMLTLSLFLTCHYNNISSCWLPSPIVSVSPAITIEMSPPDMLAMFDNVRNEEYNT